MRVVRDRDPPSDRDGGAVSDRTRRVYEPETARDDVGRLAKRVAELEQLVATLSVRQDSEEVPSDPDRVKDARWSCEKCSMLLAFYDRGEDVLRIRHKEYLAYVRVGSGGWIQIVCKACGHPNRQAYATTEEVAAAEAAVTKPRRALAE